MSGSAAAPIAPAAAAPARHMPARGHSTAPTFDGQPLNLIRFFDEVGSLGDDARIDDQAKIAYSLRYARLDDYEIWKTLPEATGIDFLAFRTAVTALYPGAEDDRRYSVTDLEKLVEVQARLGIRNRAELGQYYRDFLRISKFLIDRTRLSTAERDRAYMRGFGESFRDKVKTRLAYLLPNHFPDDPYGIEDAHKSATFILSGTTADVGEAPVAGSRAVKKEATDTSVEEMIQRITMQVVTAFSQGLATSLSQHPAHAPQTGNNRTITPNPSYGAKATPGTSTRPQAGGNVQEIARAFACLMCSGPHSIHDCDIVDEYVKKGLCKRNEEGRVVLPTGYYIPRVIPGKDFKERIDNWHAQNSSNTIETPAASSSQQKQRDPPPHLSQNLFEVSDAMGPVADALHASIEEVTDEEADPMIKAFEAEIQKRKKKVRFESVEIPGRKGKERESAEDPSMKATTPSTSRVSATSANADLRPVPYSKPTNNASTPAASSKGPYVNPGVKTLPVAPAVPQYRYQAPVEDPTLLKNVLDRALGTEVSLSGRELLAISPDIRRHFKDLATAKRVQQDVAINELAAEGNLVNEDPQETSTAVINALHNAHNSDGNDRSFIVSEDSVPLRSVYPLLDGRKKVECILDEGSQIVSMHRRVWEDLGLPLQPEFKYCMQSANSTTSSTMGCIENLKMSFGQLHLYLQVQVVEEAPYEVLLGRPFSTLTSLESRNFTNGDQHVTLTNPNNRAERVTIPTYPRSNCCPHRPSPPDF